MTQQQPQQETSLSESILKPSPAGNSLHPSWIGPRPAFESASIMVQKVRISYTSPGLQPPVYVTTSLSDPQWRPIEMEHEQKDGGYQFSKDFEASEGEYQYKFRFGSGDWWVCDESKPTVHDEYGNKNNTMSVEAQEAPEGDHTMEAPLMKHETLTMDDQSQAESVQEGTEDDSVNSGEDDDEDEGPEEPPLLRHESFMPEATEQEQAPLFRHETIAIDNKLHGSDTNGNAAAPAADSHLDNPDHAAPAPSQEDLIGLEAFPTDREGILDSIRRVSTQLPVDETEEEVAKSQPARSLSATSSLISSPSLPSVKEDEDEADEAVEQGKSEEGHEAVGAQTDGSQDDDEKPRQAENPAAPITPPMTPTEDDKPLVSATVHKDAPDELQKDAASETDKSGASSIDSGIQPTFGQWIVATCGGKTSTAILFTALIAGLAAGAWKLKSA